MSRLRRGIGSSVRFRTTTTSATMGRPPTVSTILRSKRHFDRKRGSANAFGKQGIDDQSYRDHREQAEDQTESRESHGRRDPRHFTRLGHHR